MFVAVAPAQATNCYWTNTDISYVWGTDPDGTFWSQTTYYYEWPCDDGYLGDERPCGVAGCVGGGGGGGTGGTTTPPSNPGCSFSSCISDCDQAYMEDAGVEVIGNTVIHHFTHGECGLACQALAKAEWDACRAGCATDCNLP